MHGEFTGFYYDYKADVRYPVRSIEPTGGKTRSKTTRRVTVWIDDMSVPRKIENASVYFKDNLDSIRKQWKEASDALKGLEGSDRRRQEGYLKALSPTLEADRQRTLWKRKDPPYLPHLVLMCIHCNEKAEFKEKHIPTNVFCSESCQEDWYGQQ